MPTINVSVVFHFVGNEDGENFTCDPNDPRITDPNYSWLIYAPDMANILLNDMELKMKTLTLIQGQQSDSRVRYRYFFGTSNICDNIFFYNHGQSINTIQGALNIICEDNNSGSGAYSGNRVWINNLLDNLLNGNLQWWVQVGTLNHEVGHSFGLDHTFFCDNPCDGIAFNVEDECYGSCVNCQFSGCGANCYDSSDNMMGYGPQLWITQCEHKELYSFAINSPADYRDYCNDNSEVEELVYDSGEIENWQGMRLSNADIVIESGTEIEIECDLRMGADKKIIVKRGGKLTLKGGSISSICNDRWEGIFVEGGNTDYDVKFIGGEINNAKTAVRMDPIHIPHPQITNYGNGIVQIDGTTFNGCDRIAAFVAFQPSENPSFIRNATMNGGIHGVSNWNCLGVEISGTTFNDLDLECVRGENASFNLIDNDFDSDETNLYLLNTSNGLSNKIELNDFTNATHGILNEGGTISFNDITQNNFISSVDADIFMDGEARYEIMNNDFGSFIGCLFIENGFGRAEVLQNDFSNNSYGIALAHDNTSFQGLSNCFSTSEIDILKTGLVPNQGTPNREAGNCFTHGGSQAIEIDIESFGASFSYHLFSDQVMTCKEPLHPGPSASTYDTKIGFEDNSYLDCGQNIVNPPPPQPTDSLCNPAPNEAAYIAALNNLRYEIQVLQASTQSQEYINSMTLYYNRCIQKITGLLAEHYVKNNDFHAALTLYQDNTFVGDTKLIALHLLNADYTSAISVLNNMRPVGEKELDYVYVQGMNTTYLKNYRNYTFTSQKMQGLLAIADKSHLYSANARGLYYMITGIKLYSELPPEIDVSGRSKKINETVVKNDLIQCNPNPFGDYFTIKSLIEDEVNYEILDVKGSVIEAGLLNKGENLINSRNWINGFYVLRVIDGQDTFINKIMKTNP